MKFVKNIHLIDLDILNSNLLLQLTNKDKLRKYQLQKIGCCDTNIGDLSDKWINTPTKNICSANFL